MKSSSTIAFFLMALLLVIAQAEGKPKAGQELSLKVPDWTTDSDYKEIPSYAVSCNSSFHFIVPDVADSEGMSHGFRRIICVDSAGAFVGPKGLGEVRGVPHPGATQTMVPRDMALFRNAGFRAVSCQVKTSTEHGSAGFDCFYEK